MAEDRLISTHLSPEATRRGETRAPLWRSFSASPWAVACIVLVALVVRLLALALWPAEIVSDASAYERLAWRVARGLGYTTEAGAPTAFYPPLYPYAVAGIYALVGREPGVVLVSQALLSALLSVAAFDVTHQLWRRHDVALVAALLVAIDLPAVLYPRLLLTETLFAALLALAMVAWARAWRSDRLAWWALFGVATGLAALARPPIQFLPLVALAAWPFARRRHGMRRPDAAAMRRWAAVSAVVVLMFGAAVAPWLWRNARDFGFFTPQLTSSSGTGLYISYLPLDGWRFGLPNAEVNAQEPIWAEGLRIRDHGGQQAEWDRSAYVAREVSAYLRAHPWLVLQLAPLKLVYLAWPFDWALFNGWGPFDATYVFSLPFAVLGAYRAIRGGGWLASGPLWLVLLYAVATSLVFLGAPRFRMPVQPYLHAFAALGIIVLAESRASAWRWLFGWAALAVGLALVAERLRETARGLLRAVGLP